MMTLTKTSSLVWMFFCVWLGEYVFFVVFASARGVRFVLQSEYFYKHSLLTVIRLLKVLNPVAVDTQHVFWGFFA